MVPRQAPVETDRSSMNSLNRSMSLFSDISAVQHLYMAKVMQRVVAPKGAVLCREGQVSP